MFVLPCSSSCVFGLVDNFVLCSLILHLRVFYLLMMKIFQRNLQIVCVLRLLVNLLMCVLHVYYRFLLVVRK